MSGEGDTIQSIAMRVYMSSLPAHGARLCQNPTNAGLDAIVPYRLVAIYMIDYMGKREEWKPATPGTKFHPA